MGLFRRSNRSGRGPGVAENENAAGGSATSAEDLVDIILIDAGTTPNAVYGVARQAIAFNPPNAKEYRKLLVALPQRLCTGVPRARAEALKVEFAAGGGVVELRSPDGSPI